MLQLFTIDSLGGAVIVTVFIIHSWLQGLLEPGGDFALGKGRTNHWEGSSVL